MRARMAVTAIGLLALFTLTSCQTAGPDQASDPRYGPVEDWPSTRVTRRLGRGEG